MNPSLPGSLKLGLLALRVVLLSVISLNASANYSFSPTSLDYADVAVNASSSQTLGMSFDTTDGFITTDDPDRDYLRMRLGTSAQFQNGIAGFLDFATLLAHSRWRSYNLSLGLRMAF